MAQDFGELGSAKIALRVDFGTLNKDLDKAKDQVEKSAAKIGASLAKFGGLWSAAITAPIVAGVTTVLIQLNEIDQAFDRLRAGTGKTGDALQGLKKDFSAALGGTRAGVQEAADVVAQLNARTGATGPLLQDLAKQFLYLKDVANEDGASLIGPVTRIFGDWSVATENQTKVLDRLFNAAQKTGASIGMLADQTVKYGAPLRQLGFSLDQAIALFSKWEKEGVNTEIVMSGVRRAMSGMAEAGLKDVPAAFQAMISNIKAAGGAGAANALALEYFGAKAGPDMAAAIREGRFEIQGLVTDLANSQDTILGVARENEGLWETFARNGNKIRAALADTQDQFDEMGGNIQPVVDKIGDSIVSLIAAFNNLSPTTKVVILAVAGVAAAIGPLLVALGAAIAGWPLLTAAFTGGLAAMLTVAPVIATIGAGLLALGTTVNAFKVLWENFGGDFKAIGKELAVDFDRVVGWLGDGFDSIGESLGISKQTWRSGMREMSADAADFAVSTLHSLQSVLAGLVDVNTSMEKKMRGGLSMLPDWAKNAAGAIAGIAMPSMAGTFWQTGGIQTTLIQMAQGLDVFKESLAGDPDFLKGGILPTATKQAEAAQAALKKLAESPSLDSVAKKLEGTKKPGGGGDPLAGFGQDPNKKKIGPLDAWDDTLDKVLLKMEDDARAARKAFEDAVDAMDNALLKSEQAAEAQRQSVHPEEAALVALQDLQDQYEKFPEFIDPETLGLLSGEVFKTLSENTKEGTQGIENVLGAAAKLNPVFASAGKQIEKTLAQKNIEQTLTGIGDSLEGIGKNFGKAGNAIAQIGTVIKSGIKAFDAFQKASQIAATATRISWESALGIFGAVLEGLYAITEAFGIMGEKSKEEAKGIGKIMDDIKEAAKQWGDQLTDILVNFVKTGTISFHDLANQIIDDLLRITIQEAIVTPLINYGGKVLGFADGGVFSGGKVFKAANGIVTRRQKIITPGGMGVMGEGGGPGEAVVPLSLVGGHLGIDASGVSSGGNMVVEIHNSGAPIQPQQSVDGDGVRRMKLMIHNVVNEGLASGNYDAGLSGYFGTNRRPARG